MVKHLGFIHRLKSITWKYCKRAHFEISSIKNFKYMTDFFLLPRLNLSNVLRSIAKNFFCSDFPSPCFDVPKALNFTSGGVQNRETKNRRLGTIVASFQGFKLREKQIYRRVFSYFLKKKRTTVPLLSKLISSQ